MLVSIDGIDGCGKSTQVRRLADKMGAERLQEISDSRWGRMFRALEDPSLEQQVACFLADRVTLVSRLEAAARSEEVHLVSDRSYLSTVAYQSFGSGLSPEFLEGVNRVIVPEYDLMIVLDLPVDVALGRVRSRGEKLTWCENEARLTWARRVFETWAALRENVVRVDGTRPVEAVAEAVSHAAEDASKTRFGRVLWR